MYITKKAFSEKTGVSSKTIKGKSDILRALLDCEQEASAEVAATAETVENNIEALNAEEVKVDTKSYVVALRASLRQSPDVILLGEMRDYETIDVTMTAAETGHLVFSTLHTIGAANTIDRIIDVFPASQQRQIAVQLSMVLQAIVTQQLVPDIHGEHYRVTAAQWNFLGKSFNVSGVPTYLIIDREGNIKYRQVGFPGVKTMKEELLKVADQ